MAVLPVNVGVQATLPDTGYTGSATPSRQKIDPATDTTDTQGVSSEKPAAIKSDAASIEIQGSSYQARLSYDKDRASVYIEIVSSSTGKVIQRFPAETASEQIHALTGTYSGSIADNVV